ncbi:MAG TPA: SUMF1/EgtB/PvdO family nonheme iron enzyme [Polyangiaceae bacterium]|nr:SUMF1/EgtB/PvdO family nonheme iron enzyme [Polyangiaceae bacterium]
MPKHPKSDRILGYPPGFRYIWLASLPSIPTAFMNVSGGTMRSIATLTVLSMGLGVCACKQPTQGSEIVGEASSAQATPVAASVPPPAVSSVRPTLSTTTPEPSAFEPCPQGMALVGPQLCVDQWEASLVDEHGSPISPYLPVGTKKVVAVSRPDVVPQAHISLFQATRACEAAGKRICTTQEWLDACQGVEKPKRTYPYGQKHRARACNDRTRIHPVSLVFPGRRRHDAVTLNDARLNQQPDTLAKTGAYPECKTPEGVFDLVGNLLEWTKGPTRPLLMGGHYVDSVVNGQGCHYVTPDHKEHYHDFTTGFRCCKTAKTAPSPPPTTPADAVSPPASQSVNPPPAQPPARSTRRDEPRSFHNAFGFLPHVSPPPYESRKAPCPVDMVLVQGERCAVVEQVCQGFIDPAGMPERACGQFEKTVCKGPRRQMRFCIDRYEFTSPGERLPLVNVAFPEAEYLCRKMDKRMCFEQEWEFACEGPEAWPYPYGYVRDGARCNHDKSNLFVRGNELFDQRVAADSLPGCKSPFGVFNLVGNVDEWTQRPGNKPPNRSILRGGWWLMGRNRCRAATSSHNETYAGAQTGFRCCKAAR